MELFGWMEPDELLDRLGCCSDDSTYTADSVDFACFTSRECKFGVARQSLHCLLLRKFSVNGK